MRSRLACLAGALVVALALASLGCVEVEVDESEGVVGPTVEFDPANRVIPFPNNLLLDPATGRVNLPEGCNESAAQATTREQVLNQLDGFGTYQAAMSVTFTDPVDPDTLEGNVLLYQRTADGAALEPGEAVAIPVLTMPGTTTRFDAECANPAAVDSVTIVPLVPLAQRSTYVVALTEGLMTDSRAPFSPSFTWALVRQAESPVTLDESGDLVSDRTPLDPSDPAQAEQLRGIDRLWRAHALAMGFLVGAGHERDAVLLAWEFTTQTTTNPLDPAVEGSPAAEVATGPLVGPTGTGTPVSITGVAASRESYPFLVCTTGVVDGDTVLVEPEPDDAQCFLKLTLGDGLRCGTLETCSAAYTAGSARCASIGCQAVGDVLAGALVAKSYQTETSNPRGDTCGEGGDQPCPAVPGPWDSPLAPTQVGVEGIGVLIFTTAAACPVDGCPTAIFGHGVGSSRTAAFAIAPQLAGVGFATVAIDFVAHGSRAVQISADPEIGCDPPSGPQCFAPFLSPNLAATRDNIRQSVLDLHSLAAGLDACGPSDCGALEVDPAHVVYIGQSLGGIMGSTFAAASPSLTASVLNVAGVGWADIFENTGSLTIRCSLVDALIDAGVLEGDKLDAIGKEPTGLCLGEEWKTQPGYRQFALIARWVLDPADPANFTGMLATRRVLLQEVVGDEVVPNAATDAEGALLGLAPVDRAAAVPNPEPPPLVLPDRAITESPIESKWLRYHTLPADGGTGFPGNTYQHGSLLAPTPGNDGLLATAAQQIDAIIYLLNNR